MDSTDAFTKEFIFGTLAGTIKIDRERQFNALDAVRTATECLGNTAGEIFGRRLERTRESIAHRQIPRSLKYADFSG